MATTWHLLIANLAAVALFISMWVHGRFVLARMPRWRRDAVFGIVMGLGAMATMLLTIPVDNFYFDLRSSMVAIAGFFGGPIAGAIAALIAMMDRGLIGGGPYAAVAVSGIAVATLAGIGVSALTRGRLPAIWSVGIFALAVGLSDIVVGLVFRPSIGALPPIALEVGAMNAVATAISAFFMMRFRAIERERDLLQEAFRNSPDLQYVKTPDSRFAAVNLNLARLSGFANPADMLGKTEVDLMDPERASRVMDAEQAVMAGGPPIIDSEELFVAPDGRKLWFLTSKVALRDQDGRVIGLAGVTRDVTVRRRLRAEAEDARNRLDFVLTGVSDGIAMFDRFGMLVYCNERYRQMFDRTADVRQPGKSIRDILRAVAATAEQKGIPPGGEKEWIETVAKTLDTAGDQEIELWDGRWMQIKTRPTADGTALIVVSDITTIKQAEAALVEMTGQLKLLATTDGLTGLLNRRAFDSALAEEVARSRRTGQPLSVLLADVDRFKVYNDMHGHQAGDDVLKAVGRCLRETVRRPADIAARYGGEEFVAILPDTDTDAAAFLADRFRDALKALALRHPTSECGVVTVSVGVATLSQREAGLTAIELLRRADEALYDAKEQGRDRNVVWQCADDVATSSAA